MIIAGATVNQTPIDWQNNTRNIIDAITEAKQHGVHILCFPELSITGYGCEDLFLSDWLPAEAWKQVKTIREYCDNITVAVGLPVRIGNLTYNGSCVITDKKIQGIALKQNLARDGVHYEPRWFDAWPAGKTIMLTIDCETVEAGDIIFETEGVRFGFEICEDAWRKDKRPGYRLAERGIDLILNPSASHFAMGKSILRENEVVIEGSARFRCAYVFVNLLGNEAGRMIYDGDIIIGQHGRPLAVNRRLSFKPYQVMACEIDFGNPDNSRPLPLYDSKEKNEELARAVSLGLYDYLRKSRAKGFVVSLSGGADSGLCAVLVSEMVKRASTELGWETFCKTLGLPEEEINGDWKKAVGKLLACAYQGTRHSSPETFEAARSLAISIGADFHHWSVEDEVRGYSQKIEKAIGRELNWDTDDIAMQNIQARARSPIIWMLANLRQAILITTSNRSEANVGYATMDGDTSGSLAPVAGLDKPFILQWLKWAEISLGYEGLHAINCLKPTAELRPQERQQTDESDLMPYTLLVEIEHHAILNRKSPRQVFEALKAKYNEQELKGHVKKFFRLWAANQWKRERLAPSFHLDDLNVDPRTWCRFPILSSGFQQELSELDSL